ncbi:Glutamyl-tRNA(Gln) amidotransferase subunit A, mitochondrial [Paramicrosporidium saccamoebae]|uniref:Glutamyl-tRNA(Gln) amidotransferase subunit A, mitochondrial n=1 Tax=Paramicrosporidium saccamoebae TaxID=1246581 RepID=A0A2H9TFQ6_9FUNG|nr:Glutamyl-tRNA(Gln) amidotransferase subunit A, mitochondrial [Paramicrosporidium saccamoebae]
MLKAVTAKSPLNTVLTRVHTINETLNAFTSIGAVDSMAHQSAGVLAGVLVAVKDNFHVKGHATSYYRPDWNATSVEALVTEGAVVVGKTNMDEFGMGSHSTNSIFGAVNNPLGAGLSAGGSSGGSAAAVAAGLCFKPSYGRISRNGLVAYASSLDTVGILTDCMEMTRRAFGVLRRTGGVGDMTSFPRTLPIREAGTPRIGVIATPRGDDAARGNVDHALSTLGQLGASIKPVDSLLLPALEYALATYYVSAMVEATSCLARYPSQHYTTGARFGGVVEERLRLGGWLSRKPEAINKVIHLREELAAQFAAVFEEFDFLVCPTAMTTPPLLSSLTSCDGLWSEKRWEGVVQSFRNEELPELTEDLLTVPASLAGIPAISLPINNEGLCGVQIMAAAGRDEELLDFSQQLLKHSGA